MAEHIPPPVPKPSFTWKGPEGPTSRLEGEGEVFSDMPFSERMLEKIAGSNNLRPIAFLERGIQLSSAVAHIAIPGIGSGTGVLIGDDLLLTNNHVIDSQATAREAIIRLNYQDDLEGLELQAVRTSCAPDKGFLTSPHLPSSVDADHLDFTVVRLADPVGKDFGKIVLATDASVEAPLDVVIIQHPGGQKKQIAIADNELVFSDDLVCQYLTDTLPGSSGSPVFNDRWQMIALHHAGDFVVQPGDPQGHLQNEGIRVSVIAPLIADWLS